MLRACVIPLPLLGPHPPYFTHNPPTTYFQMNKEDTESRISAAGAAGAGAAAEADNDQSSDEFEFAFVAGNLSDSSLADDAYKDGWLYPLFDRSLLGDAADALEKDVTIDLQRLMLDKQEVCPRSDSASSSSTMDDLDATAAGSYCAWTPRSVPPSPERCKKSSSTGPSSSRRWRLRDFVARRSHSDGKEKFVFLAPAEKKSSDTAKPLASEKGKGRKVTEVDLASLHRLYYDKAGGGGGARRSSLPYKQDRIGFLGLGRTQHFNKE